MKFHPDSDQNCEIWIVKFLLYEYLEDSVNFVYIANIYF